MKKIFVILALIVFFLAVGLFYINKMLLPVHIKGLIVGVAEEQLKGRGVTLGGVSYNPLKGIVLTDLLITAKNNPTKAFAQIKEVSAQVLLLPLLQKKVIVSSLRIEEPTIKLVRIDEASWNFSDIISTADTTTSSNEKPPFEIMISGLAITSGQISIEDRMSETPFIETLSPVNIKGSLTLSNNMHAAVAFSGDIGIASSKGSLAFDTRIGIADKTFKGTLKGRDVNVEQYLRFIPSELALPAGINRLAIKDLDIQALQSKEGLTISGKGSIPTLDIAQQGVATLQGQLAFDKLYVFIGASGTINAQGNISSDTFNAVLPNNQYAKGKLALTLSKLTVDKNMIEGTGSLLAKDLNAFINGIALSGNIKTTQTAFSLKDNVITADTDLDVKNGSFAMNNDIKASGNIHTSHATLTLNNKDISATGDLLVQDGALSLGKDLQASGHVKIKAASFSQNNGSMTADGDLEIKNATLSLGKDLRIVGDLDIPKAKLLPSKDGLLLNASADLKNARITLSPEQTLNGDMALSDISCVLSGTDVVLNANANLQQINVATPFMNVKTGNIVQKLNVAWKNKILDASTDAVFTALNVIIPKSITFNGAPSVSVHVNLDPAKPDSLTYEGKVDLKNGQITDAPSVGNVNAINTSLTFKTDAVTITSLSLNTMNTPLTVSGKVERFNDPYISVDVNADKIDLALVEKFIPELMKQERISLAGRASLVAHFTGRPSKPLDAQILARIKLNDASIKSDKLAQEINDMQGLLIYETPKLSWQDLKLVWQKRTIILNGTLENFESPLISGTIKTEEIDAKFTVEKKADTIAIKQLKGTYFESGLDLMGSVELPNGSAPQINLSGTAKVALRDLPKLLPAQAKEIDALKLGGIIKLTFKTKGKADDWQNLRSSITLETPALSVMGYRIEDLNASSEQKDGTLNPLTVTASVYGGTINANNKVTLTDTAFPFESSFKFSNVNIEEVKKATPAISQQQLKGLFSGVGNIKGSALDIQNISGKAVVSIREGYLWGVEALAGIMKVLASSFQNSGNMTINEADATLNFDKKHVITDDLVLKSEAMLIKGKGWIDWDQNIELSVIPELTAPATTDGTTSIASLINPTAGLVNIRVYGKMNAPKIEHNISAPAMIKKTLQNTVGGLLKLFE